MKTHSEWLRLFEDCCHLFNEEGHTGNRVRLTIGQFKDNDDWGFIEVLGWDNNFILKLVEFCEKNNLYIDFSGSYEFKLRENYPKELEIKE